MKTIYLSTALSIIVLLTSCRSSRTYTNTYAPEPPGITYQQFYDGLSPYGNWVDYQNYGYVWMPNEQGFRPYYNNGHWVYTSYGWTWVSNYSWGWAPFHYGRWLYDDFYGWMWMPGYEWAPAWVSWRSGGGCYGWAPMGPGPDFDTNMGSRIPDSYWAFVPQRYINSPRINNYYINREKNVTIINNTTVINNTNITNNKTVYVTGPSATEVEKVTNQKIRPVRIVQKNTPGNTEVSGSAVSMYKPPVRETPQQTDQVKPSRIVNLHDVRVRRENAGSMPNEIQRNPVTVDAKPERVPDRQKINNFPSVNEKANPVWQKSNPVMERELPAQQPQKVIPGRMAPVFNRETINREKNSEPQAQNSQQNNTINRQQPVINNQPEKVRVINLPNKNPESVHKNILPTPFNRQPVNTQQINTGRLQHRPLPDKEVNTAPLNHTPIVRNQNPADPGESRSEDLKKEK